jgi:antitoxin component YwqK of YwqJK toxin-antitoxin module
MKKLLILMFALFCFSATPAQKDTTFYANGSIKSCVAQQENVYKLTKYYESGAVEEIEYFNLNKERVGTWTRYAENGCIISVANFRNDKKDGDWIMYNADGKLVMFIKYKAGKREFVCCITEDNRLAVAQ